jgi:CBS domain-containing protein
LEAATTDLTPPVERLSDDSFQAFCDDMEGMFDVDMCCQRRQVVVGPVASLREHFQKLTVVHCIQAEGTLRGTFYLVFDQGGLFVLGGVIVMLPESRILEGIQRGSPQDAENLQDAAREVGNLLVGSWDRVFRRQGARHKHFLKTSTFIGKPWEESPTRDKALGQPENPGQTEAPRGQDSAMGSPSPAHDTALEGPLQEKGEALIVWYEMTIDPYPSFTCAAVFPKAVLGQAAMKGSGFPPQRIAIEVPSPNAESHVREPEKEERMGEQEDPKENEKTSPAPSSAASVSPSAVAAVLPSPSPSSEPSGPALAELLRLPASEIMEKDVVWAGPEDTVGDVIAKMQQHNVGYVLVGHNGALEGLVSSSNILGAVSLYLRPMFAKWRRPEDDATLGVKVKWIMSRPVRTVRTDATLAALIESMRRCGGRCLPVVDVHGAVQGLVTVFDLLLRIQAADKSFSWQGKPPQAPALLI